MLRFFSQIVSKESPLFGKTIVNVTDITNATYSRQGALQYAKDNYNNLCTDGQIFSKADCAHFVSCCIGNEQNQRGGGLSLGYGHYSTSTYGYTSSNQLTNKIVNSHLGKLVDTVQVNINWSLDEIYNHLSYSSLNSILSQMEPGDIIQYTYSADHPGNHMVLYLGKSGTHYGVSVTQDCFSGWIPSGYYRCVSGAPLVADHSFGHKYSQVYGAFGFDLAYYVVFANKDTTVNPGFNVASINFYHIFDNPLSEPGASEYFDLDS